MKDDGSCQYDAGNPVISYPIELNADFGKKCREQQREHGGCHDPVKKPGGKGVPSNFLWQAGAQLWRDVAGELIFLGKVSHINRMDDQEQKTCNQRNPDQKPSDMNRDSLAPGTRRPL